MIAGPDPRPTLPLRLSRLTKSLRKPPLNRRMKTFEGHGGIIGRVVMLDTICYLFTIFAKNEMP